MLSPVDRAKLDALATRLTGLRRRFIGYPSNLDFDYAELMPFFGHALNNIGDPFSDSTCALHTLEFEREVLADFARFTHAPPGEWWGYVTNGGTEGNMYGLYIARELFPEGICYFSEDTHYSVAKILRLQHTRSIMIKSQDDGEMDYTDLRETLRLYRDVPPIIFANIGTTMKGAMDNLATIRQILADLAISRYYIHADAALSGMILPFVDDPQPWHFADGADSISISGHKMIGTPFACGVAMARKVNVDRIATGVEYIGALDTTISGSRNAHSPLMLWHRLRVLGDDGCRELVAGCLAMADYTIAKLGGIGVHAWRHRNSITIVFPKPPPDVLYKWILATKRDIAHIITMPHVTVDIIDEFVSDLAAANPHAS